MRDTIEAPALVHCSCTKEIIGEKSNEENFTVYRYLKIDENGDRNIFCGDQPFLFSDDCRPYINIKAFPYCKSQYYGATLKSLITSLDNRIEKKRKEGAGETELVSMEVEKSILYGHLTYYNDQQNLKEYLKRYPCILQVIDRWFRTSTKKIVDNQFEWSQKVAKDLEHIDIYFKEILRRVKKGLNNYSLKKWKILGKYFSDLYLKMIQLSEIGSFSLSNKEFREFSIIWTVEERINWFDARMLELQDLLNNCIKLIYDEMFFATDQIFLYSRIEDIKGLFLLFYNAITALEYQDDFEFRTTLENLNIILNSSFSTTELYEEKEFLKDDSFLVCRCGGIIRIVYDGKQLRQYLNKLYPNLVVLLKFAEKELYNRIITSNYDGQNWKVPVSLINGFNLMRMLLLELEEEDQNSLIVPIVDGKEEIGFGADLTIRMKTMSDVNKKAHYVEGSKIICQYPIDYVIGKLGTVGTIISGTKTINDIVTKPDKKNIISGAASAAEIYGDYKKIEFSSGMGKLVGKILNLYDITEAVGHFCYYSTADYIGEMQIYIRVGAYDITYSGTYNVEGIQIGDVLVNYKENTKPIIKRDNQGLAYTAGKKWNIKRYENKVKLEYNLCLDTKKVKKEEAYDSNHSFKQWINNELNQMKQERKTLDN